jgi:hypothetical protein
MRRDRTSTRSTASETIIAPRFSTNEWRIDIGHPGLIATLALLRAAIGSVPMFGGEDPLADAPSPDNWHHEGLTRKAADDAGWSDQAQNALAFHADYLDSYLYSPLWWFDVANGGGPARIPIVMSSQHELVKLHFDDLVHPEAVRAMWRQYLSGTAAALIWLGHAHPGSVDSRAAMAKNVVGASLHAIQDFYSHSNWIDDEDLRERTWFEVSPERRACLSLWTGSYELPSHLGIKPHGAYLFACSVINNLGPLGRQLMNVVCHAASPFADTSLCRWIRQCQEAKPFTPPTVRGVELPDAVLWVEPGINVDTRWGAVTGVQERGLGISGREAFEAAYALAARSSCQWLHILDHVMNAAALGDFWTTVKTEGVTWDNYKTPRAPWEDFSQLPYRFISAGPYPPPQTHDDTSCWYLRLTVRTSSDTFSGTDADIVPIVNGRAYPALDHGVPPAPMVPTGSVPPTRPLDQTLLGRNDFEAGDEAAYIVGPLDEAPRTVALRNDAPDAGQTIKAAADALWRAVVGAFESLVDVFVGLWGYHADFVDEAHWTIDATSLQSLGPGVRRYFFLDCNGGSEGAYLISGWVEGTAATGAFPNGVPWRRYAVHFEKLYCVKESEWDRFTTSDEPSSSDWSSRTAAPAGSGRGAPGRTTASTPVTSGRSASRSLSRSRSGTASSRWPALCTSPTTRRRTTATGCSPSSPTSPGRDWSCPRRISSRSWAVPSRLAGDWVLSRPWRSVGHRLSTSVPIDRGRLTSGSLVASRRRGRWIRLAPGPSPSRTPSTARAGRAAPRSSSHPSRWRPVRSTSDPARRGARQQTTRAA